MKRMSEVFKLPVSSNMLFNCELVVGKNPVGGNSCVEFHSVEQVECAARAINHVDALADALQVMVNHNWSASKERRDAQKIAESALAAYRGEK